MLQLHEGMALYHGSSVEVAFPDLRKCAPHKDFGRGFYLTSSEDQAKSFARIVAKRVTREDTLLEPMKYGIVSTYVLGSIDGLDVRVYQEADAAWLHCIVAHRNGPPFENLVGSLAGADVIAGKVANDQTNATILAYMAGAYGEAGSERADEICISLLLPERLEDQVCFRSERALARLEFQGSERVWL